VKLCLATLTALAATLLLWLPAGAGASTRDHRRPAGGVRHKKISHPTHRTHRKHKHHARKRHHKRRGHRRVKRGTHKRGVHKQVNRRRPATASDSCPNANLYPNAGDIESVRAATLCLVNGERARFGVAPLIEDPRLTSAAGGHSQDMVEHHYFEHVSPSGQTLLMRLRASGFIPNGNVGYTIGENIAWGTLWLGTPRTIVKAWMQSPGHRANILDGAYRYSGIGIDPEVSEGQTGGMYTQDFGTVTG
jgi:uncharacterized protein YkwD